jgi:hypothetical protein
LIAAFAQFQQNQLIQSTKLADPEHHHQQPPSLISQLSGYNPALAMALSGQYTGQIPQFGNAFNYNMLANLAPRSLLAAFSTGIPQIGQVEGILIL